VHHFAVASGVLRYLPRSLRLGFIEVTLNLDRTNKLSCPVRGVVRMEQKEEMEGEEAHGAIENRHSIPSYPEEPTN
jgi:hypothetical protein